MELLSIFIMFLGYYFLLGCRESVYPGRYLLSTSIIVLGVFLLILTMGLH